MTELLGLPYSPWSEKARWALEARRVPYVSRLYQPLIGEPALRLKTRRWTGPVTVPVLTDDQGIVYADSATIARYADRHGEGPTLFPAEHDAAIARWIDVSERALRAGRARALRRMLGDDDALREMVPRALRHSLGPLAPRIGGAGIRRTLGKYGSLRSVESEDERVLDSALDELRAIVSRQPGPIFGALTFADLTAAQMLAFVKPPTFGLRVGRASRRTFTDPLFSERYADLLAWRDALYDAHRPRSG